MPGEGLDPDGRYRLRIGVGAQDGAARAPAAALPVLYTLLATVDPS
jgi:hypothetical protein